MKILKGLQAMIGISSSVGGVDGGGVSSYTAFYVNWTALRLAGKSNQEPIPVRFLNVE